MAEYNAILDEEPVLVLARERLQEIQDECKSSTLRHGTQPEQRTGPQRTSGTMTCAS